MITPPFILSSILLLSIISTISSLTRELYKGSEKCIFDNYYENMTVIISYKITGDFNQNLKYNENRVRLRLLKIKGQQTEEVFAFKNSKFAYKYSHSIQKSGNYKVCVYTNDNDLFKNSRFVHLQLKVDTGDGAGEMEEGSAKSKDLTDVNQKIEKLSRKMDSIDSMQNYQQKIEDKFNRNQLKSSNRVAFISMCQILIIFTIGAYQIYTLRKLFDVKIFALFK